MQSCTPWGSEWRQTAMDEEDKGFFILVLGVLAAILTIVCWWYISGGTSTAPTAPIASASHSDDGDHDDAEEVTADPEPVEEAAAPAPTEVPVEEPPALPNTVVDVLGADSSLGVISALIADNGLDATLAGDGPFTVFAPSDSAVSEAAASDSLVSLLESSAGSVLAYHVVTGNFSVDQLTEIATNGGQLPTAQGESISLSLDGDTILINGSTAIAGDPQEAGNGVVHTLDNVLVPPLQALNTLVSANPILFALGSAEIQPESFSTLDALVDILEPSNVSVSINGHTDSTGDPVLNQNLSQDRARSVLNYLVANGIEESRLSANGFGPDQPVASNDTEEGRAQNRRIEFTLGG